MGVDLALVLWSALQSDMHRVVSLLQRMDTFSFAVAFSQHAYAVLAELVICPNGGYHDPTHLRTLSED